MSSITEDLNKIKLANSILNRGSEKLGVRPMYIGEVTKKQARESSTKPKNQNHKIKKVLPQKNNSKETQEKISKLKEITQKLKSESSQDSIANEHRSANVADRTVQTGSKSKFINYIYIVVALVLVFFVVFAFKPVGSNPQQEQNLSSNQQGISKDTANDRQLIITSGDFASETSAKQYKKNLSERLGVPLRIIKDQNKFTVQIGPSYPSQEDALLVFDELSRYSISSLSLRFQ